LSRLRPRCVEQQIEPQAETHQQGRGAQEPLEAHAAHEPASEQQEAQERTQCERHEAEKPNQIRLGRREHNLDERIRGEPRVARLEFTPEYIGALNDVQLAPAAG